MGRALGLRWDCGNRTGFCRVFVERGGGISRRQAERHFLRSPGCLFRNNVMGDEFGEEVEERHEMRIECIVGRGRAGRCGGRRGRSAVLGRARASRFHAYNAGSDIDSAMHSQKSDISQ